MAEKKSKLAVNKIKPTRASVEDFLNGITPEQKREDSFVLLAMMKQASKEAPVLWNNSFVGFGIKRHKSATTGRESDWMRIGFAPRKANPVVVVLRQSCQCACCRAEKLGKYKVGMGRSG